MGQIYELANILAKEGEAYKASDALLKLAKIKGYVGNEPDTLQSLFRGVSQRDINELKQKFCSQEAVKEVSAETPEIPPQQPN